MRLRGPLVAVLVASFVWLGCEDHQALQEEANPLGPVFAKTLPECATKSAPVRDYFKDRETRQQVDEWFRDLSTYCAAQDPTLTLATGFKILRAVEEARASTQVGDPADGAMVALVAWDVMEPLACGFSGACPADLGKFTESLTDEGAFGVRGKDYPEEAVFSWGNVAGGIPYWFVEPFGGSDPVPTWSSVLNGDAVLVFGYPDYDYEPPQGTAFGEDELFEDYPYDWNVLPGTKDALSVTMCAGASEGKTEKVAHGGSFLQEGNDDSTARCDDFVDPLLSTSPGPQIVQLARAVLPFWPQALHATVKGGSASGKATEFSPFQGYEVDPVGLVEFIAENQPANATAFVPVFEGDNRVNEPTESNLICAAGAEFSEGATTCPTGYEIRVHLTTSLRSPLSGDETVMLAITAEDNNGSWKMYGEFVGVQVSVPDYGLVYQWNDLALDKPGAYKLHTYRTDEHGNVLDDDGNPLVLRDEDGDVIPYRPTNTVGLAFPAASSVKFNVNP
jgi:hypothetical protein